MIRNSPLIGKLSAMILMLSLIVAGIWAVNSFTVETLSAMRAYIRGESLWSKAQKKAIYHLNRYARTGDPSEYLLFLQRLEVPSGDQQARLELEKPNPEWTLVEQGFLRGGNHPDDLPSMANLFRRFRHIDPMDRAIDIWEQGDVWINRLRQLGREIHRYLSAGHSNPKLLNEFLEEADRIDRAVTPLENAFSATLGEGARRLRKIMWRVHMTSILIFFAFGCWMAFWIARTLSQEKIYELNRTLERHVGELEAANHELDSFCYSVSHDLRAPLRALRGYSDILLEEHAPGLNLEGKQLLQSLRRNVGRMDSLVEALLNFSRLSQEPISKAPIDMTALAQAVAEEVKALERGRNIQFHVDPLALAHGDPVLLREVWANLLSNAVKFSRGTEEAVIRVGGFGEGEKQIYYVKDNGVGFDEQYAKKLFGVFQRLHTEKEFEGIGVGLALVQRIIHRHGGSVRASGALGKGATFYFSLPK